MMSESRSFRFLRRGVPALLCAVTLAWLYAAAPPAPSLAGTDENGDPQRQVLAEVAGPFEHEAHPEVPLAVWQARAMLAAVPEAEIAVMNGPGIRARIEPGELTRRDLERANPFGNHLVTLKIPGELLARGVRNCFRHRPLQLAGAVVEHADTEALRVLVGGEQIDANRRYRVVTVSFVAEQQRSMFALRRGEETLAYEAVRDEDSGEPLLDVDVFAQAAHRAGRLDPEALAGSTYRPGHVLGVYPASHVADGDTMRVDGLRRAIRFQGIDTEEDYRGRRVYVDGEWQRRTGEQLRELAERDFAAYVDLMHAGRQLPPKYGTPMAEAATEYVQTRLEAGDLVRLELDGTRRPTDIFDRWLAYVFYRRDGEDEWRNLCVELVREGYTPYYFKYGYAKRFHDELLAAQREAQAQRRGIWAGPGAPGVPDHYPDYAERLENWRRSAEARRVFEEFRATHPAEDVPIETDGAVELERMRNKLGEVVTVFTHARTSLDERTVRCDMALHPRFQLRFESAEAKRTLWRSAFAGEMIYVHGRLARNGNTYYVVPQAIVPGFLPVSGRLPVTQ